ncbi:hypothetical protein N566_12465 [Streptomycetaceae bacterium MP113-05]|nr:hypothetical protein N566_12465 [Streptomycetaceae bacterium MP113-05]
MRTELRACGAPEGVVDDAVLILSELLSNACRHARPLSRTTGAAEEFVQAAWSCARSGEVTIAVTDGGGPTRPLPSKPSVTARGGRGLAIITSLAMEWGVDEHLGAAGRRAARADGALGPRPAGVTVWAVLTAGCGGFGGALSGLDMAEFDEELNGELDGEFDELGGLGTA